MASLVPVAWRRLGVIFGIVLGLAPEVVQADVVVVVSARNPATTLSRNQVADIFLGRSSHFPDGSAAVPVDQSEGSAARDEFYASFTGKLAAQLKAHWSKIIFTGRGQPPKDFANGAEVRKFVAAHPNAIGYIEKGKADASVKILEVR
jgi:ABC-type phosphate transport system substrate-binding protein